jgi:hypothetical protein
MKIELTNRNRMYVQCPEDIRIPLPEGSKVLRISSMIIKDVESNLLYDSGDYLCHMRSDIQKRYFKRLFTVTGVLDVEGLQSCFDSLNDLKQAILKLGIYFENSSVMILYSKVHKQCLVKYIDFSYYPQKLQPVHIDGLNELINILSELLAENPLKKE